MIIEEHSANLFKYNGTCFTLECKIKSDPQDCEQDIIYAYEKINNLCQRYELQTTINQTLEDGENVILSFETLCENNICVPNNTSITLLVILHLCLLNVEYCILNI